MPAALASAAPPYVKNCRRLSTSGRRSSAVVAANFEQWRKKANNASRSSVDSPSAVPCRVADRFRKRHATPSFEWHESARSHPDNSASDSPKHHQLTVTSFGTGAQFRERGKNQK
jgi:hypothetical protein